MFLPVKNYFPVKFMLGVPCVSSPWKTIPCEIYVWCPICFFLVKNYSREIYAWCPICFFPVKNYFLWNLCLCPICFFPMKNYSLLNLCLVSHMFLPREKLSPVKLMLGVPFVFPPFKPPPVSFTLVADTWRPYTRHSCWKFIVIALCPQLTRGLLAIAMFLSHVGCVKMV